MTIRNDATRVTLRPQDGRRPRSVVARQGQVLLDTDLDQQSRHLLDRVETESGVVLGSPGRLVVPPGSDAFRITPAATPAACGIGAGHAYLDGWLVENVTSKALLTTQPHPRDDATPAPPVLLVLKALVRYSDPVEEPVYADAALGDAQASGRALVDWQVFPFVPKAGWGGAPACATVTTHAGWTALVAPSTGTLTVVPDAVPQPSDPCSLTPKGGYSRSENLLYRIEVHGGVKRTDLPDADGPRFGMTGLKVKLSRRNASVLAQVTDVDGTKLTVQPPALDLLNWFAPGRYAELVTVHDDVDPRAAIAAERLFQVAQADDSSVTLDATAAALATEVKKSKEKWYVRLWDTFGGDAGIVTVQADPIDLGDGLKAVFGKGTDDTFRRGDHWTFSARADGTIDWPAGQAETPHGPRTRYAPLGIVTATTTVTDCRIPAATLTDRAMLYRGGDGQEVALPAGGGFTPLPARLRVAVMRGRTPVLGAEIEWSMPAGGVPSRIGGVTVKPGQIATTTTDATGLVDVEWSLDPASPDATHQVQARLDDGPPLLFSAVFRAPAGGTAPVPPTLELSRIFMIGGDELIKPPLIRNGLEVTHDAFIKGILFATTLRNKPIRPQSAPQPFDPIVEVELDLPYPGTDADKIYWALASAVAGKPTEVVRPFGFHRMRLEGKVTLVDNPEMGVLWEPSDLAKAFLRRAPEHRWGHRIMQTVAVKDSGWLGGDPTPVLCRLRVRSAHVWAEDPNTGERAYLNAEYLGTKAGDTNRELDLRERDPQRAADLDMFIYLKLN